MRRSLLASIVRWGVPAWFALLPVLHAQLPEQSTEAHQIEGETVVEWFGYQGRTYFIQVSDDSDPLQKWTWAPVIETGNDELISYEFGGSSPSGFARLHYTDTPKPEGVTYEAWDADRDGLSNVDELSATPQSDPLKADTDGDGLPDGWERLNGLNPVDNGSTSGSDGWMGDADGDGASNGREMEELTEANNANSFPPDFWGVRNHIYAWSDTITYDPDTVWLTTWGMPWEGSQEPEQYWGDHLEPDMGAQLLSEMPAFPGSLADALEGNAASRTQGLSTSTESQFWRSHSGGNSRNANFAQSRNWIRLPASATARYFQFLKVTDVRTEDAYSGATISHLMTAASKEVVTVLANQTESSPVDLLPVSPAVADAQATIARVSLVRLESAPDVLAVNSDFDEGRIDATTHFAIPDCDDMAGVDLDTGVGNTLVELDAERNHLDAKHLQGDDVVDDLHRGWFGVRPDALAPNLWEGATITVRKIDRIDTSTGRKESGQVRFYAKWSSGYYGIDAYDFQTLQPVNLVTAGVHGRPNEGVYGPASTIPAGATYYMEGVRPGRITLEWRLQKGDIDVKHEQTFQVETRKPVQEWNEEVRYQIRLQTKVQSGFEVDLALYHPGNGFRPTDTANQPPEWDNRPRVRAIYYYYSQLFQQMPEKFMWAGMAKAAAAPIYAGMSDLTSWWQLQQILPGGDDGNGTELLVDGLLLGGQLAIFSDKAWAHRAFMGSGIWALNWVGSQTAGNPPTDFEAWTNLHLSILDDDIIGINRSGRSLLEREQLNVVQQYYYDYTTIQRMRQPYGQSLVGAVAVTEDSNGLVVTGEWLSANANKNPMPGGPRFRDVVPAGRIDVFVDRWAWTNNASNGMLPIWTGDATSSTAPKFDAAKRMSETIKKMEDSANPYSFDASGLPEE